jgi:hypothetical protein
VVGETPDRSAGNSGERGGMQASDSENKEADGQSTQPAENPFGYMFHILFFKDHQRRSIHRFFHCQTLTPVISGPQKKALEAGMKKSASNHENGFIRANPSDPRQSAFHFFCIPGFDRI